MSISPPSPARQLDYSPFPGRRFTVDEYHRMGKTGVLTEDDRVELLEGWIVPKMIHNPAHDGTVGVIDEILGDCLPSGWHIRIQSAITTLDSEPESDLVIARGRARDYLRRHPKPDDIALVIEVADSSLSRDREKQRLYARAGVATYWIVHLVDRQVEVYTEPTGAGVGFAYGRREEFGPDAEVPLAIENQTITQLAVCELLP